MKERMTNEFGEVFHFEGTTHRGWKIGYGGAGSASWRAVRYGVGVRANTREALVRLIDQKIADDANWTFPWAHKEGPQA